MGTLLLTKSEVEKLLVPEELLPGLRRAFVAYSANLKERARRVRSRLPGPGTATVLFPGVTPGVPAIGGVGLGPDAIAAELGEVLGGAHPGRTSPEQVTVYGGVGLAFQDVVAAWVVYEAARLHGVGREIDFVA